MEPLLTRLKSGGAAAIRDVLSIMPHTSLTPEERQQVVQAAYQIDKGQTLSAAMHYVDQPFAEAFFCKAMDEEYGVSALRNNSIDIIESRPYGAALIRDMAEREPAFMLGDQAGRLRRLPNGDELIDSLVQRVRQEHTDPSKPNHALIDGYHAYSDRPYAGEALIDAVPPGTHYFDMRAVANVPIPEIQERWRDAVLEKPSNYVFSAYGDRRGSSHVPTIKDPALQEQVFRAAAKEKPDLTLSVLSTGRYSLGNEPWFNELVVQTAEQSPRDRGLACQLVLLDDVPGVDKIYSEIAQADPRTALEFHSILRKNPGGLELIDKAVELLGNSPAALLYNARSFQDRPYARDVLVQAARNAGPDQVVEQLSYQFNDYKEALRLGNERAIDRSRPPAFMEEIYRAAAESNPQGMLDAFARRSTSHLSNLPFGDSLIEHTQQELQRQQAAKQPAIPDALAANLSNKNASLAQQIATQFAGHGLAGQPIDPVERPTGAVVASAEGPPNRVAAIGG